MKKATEYFASIYKRLQLNTKAEKRLYYCAFALLTAHVFFILYGQFILLEIKSLKSFFISMALAVAVCTVLPIFISKLGRQRNIHCENKKVALLLSLAVFLISFAIFYSYQKAYYPGSFSPDSLEQYGQILNGKFNDWHPALHTLIIFGIPNLISSEPALIITFQILLFALALAYLYYVLSDTGCSKAFMVLSYLFIIANPNTSYIMLYPWKDSAFTIFATFVFAQLVRIYRTDGRWLFKWYNIFSFSLFLFLANSMRHNAVILTITLILVLLVFFKNARARVAVVAAAVILCTFVVKVPLYSLLDVESPDRRSTEVLGLPMTVLQNIYMEDREALSDECVEFMDSLATQENWKKYHRFSNFNSVKWSDEQISYKIEEKGARDILKYTFEAWKNSPVIAFKSFLSLTSMVWSIDSGNGWNIGYGITGNEYDIKAEFDTEKAEELRLYQQASNRSVTKYLFNFTGVIMLVLLLCALAKIGNGGIKKAFAVIPLIAYNFVTMLLLTGHDFRFFHLNFVVAVPLLYILFMHTEKNNDRDIYYEKSR